MGGCWTWGLVLLYWNLLQSNLKTSYPFGNHHLNCKLFAWQVMTTKQFPSLEGLGVGYLWWKFRNSSALAGVLACKQIQICSWLNVYFIRIRLNHHLAYCFSFSFWGIKIPMSRDKMLLPFRCIGIGIKVPNGRWAEPKRHFDSAQWTFPCRCLCFAS